MTNTAIAFIVFNRPKYTKETFTAIRAARPNNLYIIADGPRDGFPNDDALCSEVKSIVEQIDWPCQVHKNYAEKNLGLKKRVSTGLDWVFEHEDRAIIIEDDCLTHPDFFNFCDILLTKYQDDERIWVISGDNHQMGRKRGDGSYYFSKYSDCWGWATWRRAWKHYQGDIPFWPDFKESPEWKALTPNLHERAYWDDILSRVHSNAIYSSWFYPWLVCVWHKGGITATANVNLVSNIGIGPNATHTIKDTQQPGVPISALGALTHPSKIEVDTTADNFAYNHRFEGLKRQFPRNLIPIPRRVAGNIYRYLRRKFFS